jgi:hypothetical protein
MQMKSCKVHDCKVVSDGAQSDLDNGIENIIEVNQMGNEGKKIQIDSLDKHIER